MRNAILAPIEIRARRPRIRDLGRQLGIDCLIIREAMVVVRSIVKRERSPIVLKIAT